MTSGVRLGSPAATTCGFGAAEFRQIGLLIDEVLDGLSGSTTARRRRRGRGGRPGSGAVRLLPHGPLEVAGDALPVLRPRRHAGQGQPAERGRQCDPSPPLLRALRPALHHDRTHPVARTTVVKSDNRRVPFDRDKLARSIRVALNKRPVQEERIERIVNGIVRQLEASGESDIPSKQIGELVMDTLKEVDPVAYVRFASVYRNSAKRRTSRTSSARWARTRSTSRWHPLTTTPICARPGTGGRGLGNTWPNPSVAASW